MAVSFEHLLERVDVGDLADRIGSLESMLMGNRGRGGQDGEELLLIAPYCENQQGMIASFFRVGLESDEPGALADIGTSDLEIAEMLKEHLEVSGYFVFEYNGYDEYVLTYYFSE